MKWDGVVASWLVWGLIALLFAGVLHRAASLSMTWDEAYTVMIYAAHGDRIFSPKDFLPNNHVPHTILVWLCFQVAPWQEFALRLPACLGALGCLLALRQIGRFCFSERQDMSAVMLLIAMVSLHPLVFPFYSFARGYGLSLCFSLMGFYVLIQFLGRDLGDPQRECRLLLFGGVAFGLSVAFNLSSALLNTGLIFAAFFLEAMRGRLTVSLMKRIVPLFCLPGLLIVGGLYGPILPFVSSGQFNYASETPMESVFDLTRWSLGVTNVLADSEMRPILLGVPISPEVYWLSVMFLPFIVVLPAFAGAVVVSTRKPKEPKYRSNGDALRIVTLGLSIYGGILLVLWFLGRPAFPKDRTGIYVIAYFGILVVLLFGELRRFRIVLGIGIVVTLIHFVSLFSLPYAHNIWFADSDVRSVMETVKKHTGNSERHVFVCSWVNIASAEFYARKFGVENLEIRCSRQEGDAIRWGRQTWESRDPAGMFLYFPSELEEEFLQEGIPIQRLRKSPVLEFELFRIESVGSKAVNATD